MRERETVWIFGRKGGLGNRVLDFGWECWGKVVERWKEKVGLVVAQAMDVCKSSLCFVGNSQSSFVSEKKEERESVERED